MAAAALSFTAIIFSSMWMGLSIAEGNYWFIFWVLVTFSNVYNFFDKVSKRR